MKNACRGILVLAFAFGGIFLSHADVSLGLQSVALSGGNGNGVVDFNECNDLEITLENSGATEATGVLATLATSTPGTYVTEATSAYPDIGAGAAAANAVPFKLSTSRSFPCTTISLNLSVVTAQGTFEIPISLEGRPRAALRFDNDTPIEIPEQGKPGTSSIIESPVTVSGVAGPITKVTVSFHLTHTRDNDLQILLVSPDTTITLVSRRGANGDDFGTACSPDSERTTLDDSAATAIGSVKAPFVGVYTPDQPLSLLNGKVGAAANGTWKLHVIDTKKRNNGTLQCWSLVIEYADAEDGGGTCVGTPTAELSIAKAASPDPALNGEPLTYTILVTNNGPDQATGVVVTDYLDPGTNFVSASASRGSVVQANGVVTCDVGTMGSGSTETVTIVVTPTVGGLVGNTANVVGNESDPIIENNLVSIETAVALASDLSITKTDSPDPVLSGANLTYNLVVMNGGPDDAANLTITDELPAGVTFVSATSTDGSCSISGTTVTCNVDFLLVGDALGVTIVVTPTGVGTIMNQASVTSTGIDPDPGNNEASAQTTVNEATDLALTKTGDPQPAGTGQTVTYTLTVTNNGPREATSVTLVDSLPADATFLGAACDQGVWMESGGTVTFWLGSLPNGGVATAAVTVYPTSCASLVNAASVTSELPDPVPGNNSASEIVDTRAAMQGAFIWSSDDFSVCNINLTPGGTTGWTPLGEVVPGRVELDCDTTNTALRTIVYGVGDGSTRIGGFYTGNSERMPYTMVGPDRYVRAKFHVFASGQTAPSDMNQIPNMRFRVCSRFAVNSMLEVFNHLSYDPAGTLQAREIGPSTDPANPSVYRVDYDPVDVPAQAAAGEAISRGIEAYCLENQENGYLELAESSIGVYPADCLSDAGPAAKVYAVTASDAGDLKLMNLLTDLSCTQLRLDGTVDPTTEGLILHSESGFGVTLDSRPVPTDRVGVMAREFFPGADRTARVRVQQGKQYKIRWHVTSSTNANSNPQLRLRARAIKFMWSQKLEIGGAYAIDGFSSVIAQQTLPGTGCVNPDRDGSEQGGWYTMLVHTPMSLEIRPDKSGPIENRMPLICAQPGPGVDANSTRDLRVAFDLIDTLSNGIRWKQEAGAFTLDQVIVREYDLVDD